MRLSALVRLRTQALRHGVRDRAGHPGRDRGAQPEGATRPRGEGDARAQAHAVEPPLLGDALSSVPTSRHADVLGLGLPMFLAEAELECCSAC